MFIPDSRVLYCRLLDFCVFLFDIIDGPHQYEQVPGKTKLGTYIISYITAFPYSFFQITDITALEKVIIKRGKKLKFPYGSTQARSIEGAICSINWLLKVATHFNPRLFNPNLLSTQDINPRHFNSRNFNPRHLNHKLFDPRLFNF